MYFVICYLTNLIILLTTQNYKYIFFFEWLKVKIKKIKKTLKYCNKKLFIIINNTLIYNLNIVDYI